MVPWIRPKLSEVHVESEVHELVADFPHVEDVEGDSNGDWWTAIVGSNTSVVTNLAMVSVYNIYQTLQWKTLYLKILQQGRDIENF